MKFIAMQSKKREVMKFTVSTQSRKFPKFLRFWDFLSFSNLQYMSLHISTVAHILVHHIWIDSIRSKILNHTGNFFFLHLDADTDYINATLSIQSQILHQSFATMLLR